MDGEQGKTKEFRLTALLNVLLLLQEFVVPRPYWSKPTTDQQQDVFHDLLCCEGAPDLEKEAFSKIDLIENLLIFYKKLMNEISFDDWIEASEMVCDTVLHNVAGAGVEYWPGTDSAAPSNMQMLLAHHQALCCHAFKVIPLLFLPLYSLFTSRRTTRQPSLLQQLK